MSCVGIRRGETHTGECHVGTSRQRWWHLQAGTLRSASSHQRLEQRREDKDVGQSVHEGTHDEQTRDGDAHGGKAAKAVADKVFQTLFEEIKQSQTKYLNHKVDV